MARPPTRAEIFAGIADDPRGFANPNPFVPTVGQPIAPVEDPLTAEEKEAARASYSKSKCTWCGGLHLRACPRVKRMVFAADGKAVIEVEYWSDTDWDATNVVWPEEIGWAGDDDGPGDSNTAP